MILAPIVLQHWFRAGLLSAQAIDYASVAPETADPECLLFWKLPVGKGYRASSANTLGLS
jgi:hypothetical protein